MEKMHERLVAAVLLQPRSHTHYIHVANPLALSIFATYVRLLRLSGITSLITAPE